MRAVQTEIIVGDEAAGDLLRGLSSSDRLPFSPTTA
jgi:hypothetical protein